MAGGEDPGFRLGVAGRQGSDKVFFERSGSGGGVKNFFVVGGKVKVGGGVAQNGCQFFGEFAKFFFAAEEIFFFPLGKESFQIEADINQIIRVVETVGFQNKIFG